MNARRKRPLRAALVSSALLASGLLGGAAVLPGCNGGGDDGTGPVHIAVCGPMTGSAAAFGEMIRNAALLKEKEINAAGGFVVNGVKRPVKVEVFDDKGDITEATNVSRKVAGDDRIVMVVGHFNSVCSNNAKEEYDRAGIPAISPGSTNVKICKGYPFMFRNLYRDDYQGDQIAVYLKSRLGISKAAVLFDNDDYGKGLMQSFRARAGEVGLEVIDPIDYLRERTQDFKPLVQKAKAAGAEAIFVAGLYNDAALIAKAAKLDLGMNVPIIGGDGVMSPTFITNAGAAAEGALVTTPFLFNTGNDSEAAKSFMGAFEAEFGKQPDTWAALTYDAFGMALEAISAVGTGRKAVRDHLASIQSEASGYVGVTGTTYFDSEGDCYSKPVYVAVVKDGQFVPAPKQLAK